ncbi:MULTISPECIES: hypothetical protein [Roseomonadaceae]|uniref:Uncharacterized protein n=1 Tax=Falsiroseomonas oleicola TaxID=2801474 RepID=A0ABS6H5M0_9PROT|nr:hypothetical protein [Roseomonas oleicola]MBU8543979.1 hypothetical protein [Roseomonas oleicola]
MELMTLAIGLGTVAILFFGIRALFNSGGDNPDITGLTTLARITQTIAALTILGAIVIRLWWHPALHDLAYAGGFAGLLILLLATAAARFDAAAGALQRETAAATAHLAKLAALAEAEEMRREMAPIAARLREKHAPEIADAAVAEMIRTRQQGHQLAEADAVSRAESNARYYASRRQG